MLAEQTALEGERDALIAAATVEEAEKLRALEAETGQPQLAVLQPQSIEAFETRVHRIEGGSPEAAELFDENEKVRVARERAEALRKEIAGLQGVEYVPPPPLAPEPETVAVRSVE